MRKTSGPQSGSTSNYYVRKDNVNKAKSPARAKIKSRGKIVQQASNSNIMPTRKGASFSKNEQNQSSTYFTQNNKSKKQQLGPKKSKDLKKYQKQIMQVLNLSASIIQRQWRKYLIRKFRKSLQQKQCHNAAKKQQQNIQFDQISARTSQVSQVYDNKKYYSIHDDDRKKINENSFNRNVFSFNLSDKKQKISESIDKNRKVNSKQKLIHSQMGHNRTRSGQPALNSISLKSVNEASSKIQIKNLQMVPHVINVVIESQSPEKKQNQNRSSQSIKTNQQIKYQDHYIKNSKGSLEDILRKLQIKLQEKRLKKILALENSFSSNLMTFRSYKKNIESVAEEHQKKLSLLQNKKKKLLDKFNQLVDFCQNIQEVKQQQDDGISQGTKRENIISTQNHHIDLSFNEQMSGLNSRSMTLGEWDLDSHFSDKKLPQMQKRLQSSGKQSQQILIDQNQKDNTIINQLYEYNNSGSKNNSKELIKQTIKQTKPESDNNLQIQQLCFIDQKQKQKQAQIQQNNHQVHHNSNNQTQTKAQGTQNNQINPLPQYQVQKSKIINKVRVASEVNAQEKVKYCQRNIQNQKTKEAPAIQATSFSNVKKFTQIQVLQQLKKFHPIKPSIDVVNNWLLEVSHFILDNFGGQILKKLISIEQPHPLQLLRHCITGQPFLKQYCSISQKIFKQFQFFHIKTLITDQSVENDKKQSFSALMYTFHQALYDCLNRMLLDQLIEGRNWIKYPWANDFKVRKLIGSDHSKQCLQKAINRVSNISDYNIIPIDPLIQGGRQFEQTQHNLIFAQQIKQIPLQCEIQRGNLIYKISKVIEQSIIEEQINLLKCLF